MTKELTDAITTILKVYDRYPIQDAFRGGVMIAKKDIAEAVEVLRTAKQAAPAVPPERAAPTAPDPTTFAYWTGYLCWAARQRDGATALRRVWESCLTSDFYRTTEAEAALYLRGYYDGLYDYLAF